MCGTVLICVTVLLGVIHGQPRGAIRIISPASGSTVYAGQLIPVSVYVSPGTDCSGGVALLTEQPLQANGIITKGPYTFQVTVPATVTPRQYSLTAICKVSNGSTVSSSRSQVEVALATGSVHLSVDPASLTFRYIGEPLTLNVVGQFSDGATVDVGEMLDAKITSDNPSVATVSGPGTIVAAGSGSANIVIQYAGQSLTVPVTVLKTVPGDLNGDGRVDQDDVNIILSDLDTPAKQPFDARDLDHDGTIDMHDAALLQRLCTSPCGVPPDVSQAKADPATVWPPNHQLVPINILGVTDPSGNPVALRVDEIRQDEPVGSNDDMCSVKGVGTDEPEVRAERNGSGDGRVYSIWFTATGSGHQSSQGIVKVCVPHDSNGTCTFSKPSAKSTACE